jgi:hypothetical protein
MTSALRFLDLRAAFTALPLLAGLVALASLASLTACSGATVDVGALDGGPGSGAGEGGTGTSGDGGAGGGDAATSGPEYEVHLRATQAPVTFTDSNAGETPLDQHIAIRKLTLFRDANDTAPVVIFDNGQNAVECGLNDGNDTIAGRAIAANLPAGTFTVAHVTVGFYRFKVAATMHANGMTIPGDYSDIEVLTDSTLVDGKLQNQGHYSFTFEAGGSSLGTLTGETLMVPAILGSGGLSLVTSNHEANYVFPVSVVIDPKLTATAKVVMQVNTYKNFRWQDQTMTGYQTGVFDTTASTYEPVMSFGANSFTLGLE